MKNDQRGLFPLAIFLTIAIAIAIVLVALGERAVRAGETEVSYIDATTYSAVEAFDADEYEEYATQLRNLADTFHDGAVSPACRDYADLMLTVVVVVENRIYYETPNLIGLEEILTDNIEAGRSACMLAF